MGYYVGPERRWRREFVTMAERDVVAAVEAIAAGFTRYEEPDRVGACRDVEVKAVQIYLFKSALGWGLSRIGRRFADGISLQYAMLLYPRGRDLVAKAVEASTITPATVARLLPDRVFF